MRCFLRATGILVITSLLAAGAAAAGNVYLGITMDEIKPSMARALGLDEDQGVLINDVVDGSPAAEAGLEPGDVLLKVSDHEITGISKLTRTLHAYDPGDEVELTVLREGKRKTLDVVLGEREKNRVMVFGDGDKSKSWSWFGSEKNEDGETVLRWEDEGGEREVVIGNWLNRNADRGFLGVVPASESAEDLAEMGVPEGKGVLVASVLEDGPAHAAGLEDGDVILTIDGDRIDDRNELHERMQDTRGGQKVTVEILRDGKTRTVEIELADSPAAVEVGNSLRMLMPDDPHAPKSPRFYEFHSGQFPAVLDRDELEAEREDLEELRGELSALKEELKKLREELAKQKK